MLFTARVGGRCHLGAHPPSSLAEDAQIRVFIQIKARGDSGAVIMDAGCTVPLSEYVVLQSWIIPYS